ATLGLWTLQAYKVTHIIGQSGTIGPYSSVQGIHGAATGLIYALLSIFTNLGANPAFNTTVVRNIPHNFVAGRFSVGGLGYVVTLAVCLLGLVAMAVMLRRAFIHNRRGEDRLDTP